MTRFIIAVALFAMGLLGLFLTTCGGILLGEVSNRSGASSDRQFAYAMFGGGALILVGTVWGIVWLIRNWQSPRKRDMQAHLDMLARQKAGTPDPTDPGAGTPP